MKENSFLRLAVLSVVVLFLASLLPVSSMAAPIKLNYATFGPPRAFLGVQMERWKKVVEERTGGKLEIKTYPGQTLLSTKNMFDGVVTGQADISTVCFAYQPGRFMVANAFSLPIAFPNTEVASLSLWDIYNKYKPKEFAKVKILHTYTCAPSQIYGDKPVRKLEDLKGLQIRASGGALRILKIWGASPVGMPMSEVPEAIQKGVIKGLFTSLEVLLDLKLAEYCRYATIVNGPVYPFATIMNLDKWNSLPKDVQEVLDGMGVEHSWWVGNYFDKHVEESVEWSKKNYNIDIYKLPKKELAQWNKMLTPLIDKWIEGAKAKGIPARAILKDIKVAKEYHSRF